MTCEDRWRRLKKWLELKAAEAESTPAEDECEYEYFRGQEYAFKLALDHMNELERSRPKSVKISYDPEAAAIYIWLSERKAESTLRLPQGGKGDIYWINVDFAKGSICGIELLLNPDSRLKYILDDFLKEAEEKSPETAGVGAVLDFHSVSVTGGVGCSGAPDSPRLHQSRERGAG